MLSDLSAGYRESAQLLRERLHQLRTELAATTDPEEVWSLKRRIAQLTPMLTEMNTLAELTERYYDRRYYRDARYSCNCFDPRGEGGPQGEAKRHPFEDFTSRIDGTPAGCLYEIPSQGSEHSTNSSRAGCQQEHRKPHFEKSRATSVPDHTVPVSSSLLEKFFK